MAIRRAGTYLVARCLSILLAGEKAQFEVLVPLLLPLLVIALDDETQHRFTTVFRLTLGSW